VPGLPQVHPTHVAVDVGQDQALSIRRQRHLTRGQAGGQQEPLQEPVTQKCTASTDAQLAVKDQRPADICCLHTHCMQEVHSRPRDGKYDAAPGAALSPPLAAQWFLCAAARHGTPMVLPTYRGVTPRSHLHTITDEAQLTMEVSTGAAEQVRGANAGVPDLASAVHSADVSHPKATGAGGVLCKAHAVAGITS
jgi:hypothetical protein